jgi:hypothetical protein
MIRGNPQTRDGLNENEATLWLLAYTLKPSKGWSDTQRMFTAARSTPGRDMKRVTTDLSECVREGLRVTFLLGACYSKGRLKEIETRSQLRYHLPEPSI